MAVNLIVNPTRNFVTDADEIGQFDPGDVIYHRVTIQNTGSTPATGVTFTDISKGQTLVAGTFNISPIANNDSFTAIGNTVLRVGTNNTINGGESTFVAGNVLSNDAGDARGLGVIAGDDRPGFQIDTVTSGISAKGGTFNLFSDGTFNYVNSPARRRRHLGQAVPEPGPAERRRQQRRHHGRPRRGRRIYLRKGHKRRHDHAGSEPAADRHGRGPHGRRLPDHRGRRQQFHHQRRRRLCRVAEHQQHNRGH
jgi:uncharacterized repeat protein (TIGR01451 family)